MKEILTEAVYGESETVTIKYRSASKNEITEREISNIWAKDYDYIVAFCHLRKTVRSFALKNILEVKINDKPIDKEYFFSDYIKNRGDAPKKQIYVMTMPDASFIDTPMFIDEAYIAEKTHTTLEGIVTGMLIDDEINDIEISKLKDWCADNYGYFDTPLYSEFIHFLFNLKDNITLEERTKFYSVFENIKTPVFQTYYYRTTDIRVLHGILHGILLDGIIKTEEINGLYTWIKNHENLKYTYPYDDIRNLLFKIFYYHKEFDDDENKKLKAFFAQFVDIAYTDIKKTEIEQLQKAINIPNAYTLNPNIEFKNKIFCFTGISSHNVRRKTIAEIISVLDGVYNDDLTDFTNYLVVGDKPSLNWAYVRYGRKFENAVNHNKPEIIKEADFWSKVDSFKRQEVARLLAQEGI